MLVKILKDRHWHLSKNAGKSSQMAQMLDKILFKIRNGLVGPFKPQTTMKERWQTSVYMSYSGFYGWFAAYSEIWAALGCSLDEK